MHSPLEIARNYIEVGIHKVNLSIFKTILLGFFAGMFIGFAGIASTTASSTIGIASVAKLVGAAVFPAGMAMVLVAGSELFTGNNLIILAVLEKKVTVWKMLKNWLFVYIGNFLGAAFVAVLVVVGRTPDLFGEQLAQAIVNAAASRTNLSVGEAFVRGILCNILVCIAVWIVGQAFVNIGVVVGLLPVMGVPMPFVSAGGSSLIMCLGAAGVAISLMKEQPQVKAENRIL